MASKKINFQTKFRNLSEMNNAFCKIIEIKFATKIWQNFDSGRLLRPTRV